MIDGLDNHFIHVRWRHSYALPLVMTHGKPGSVFELLKTVGRLGSPAPWRTRGGRGPQRHGFDSRLRLLRQAEGHRFGPDRTARAWAELMNYTHYVVQGGDSGAPISSAMARQATAGLLRIHITCRQLFHPVSPQCSPIYLPRMPGIVTKNSLQVPVPLSPEYTVLNFSRASDSNC
jgi:epoxide hydrolase-like protein